MDDGRRVRDAPFAASPVGADEPLGGEEGHLGVVRDLPCSGAQIPDAVLAEPRADLHEAHELDRSAQSVPTRAGEDAAADSILPCQCQQHRPSPHIAG